MNKVSIFDYGDSDRLLPSYLRPFYCRRFFTIVIGLALLCAGCAQSSPPATQAPQAAASPVAPAVRTSADVVKATPASISITAGGSANATLNISISPGYHVNANPATFPYLIATQVVPQQTAGLTPGKPVYPKAEKKKFQFAEEPLSVYESESRITIPLRALANATRGIRPLPINVTVQACDNEKCYPPATLKSYISVEVR